MSQNVRFSIVILASPLGRIPPSPPPPTSQHTKSEHNTILWRENKAPVCSWSFHPSTSRHSNGFCLCLYGLFARTKLMLECWTLDGWRFRVESRSSFGLNHGVMFLSVFFSLNRMGALVEQHTLQIKCLSLIFARILFFFLWIAEIAIWVAGCIEYLLIF